MNLQAFWVELHSPETNMTSPLKIGLNAPKGNEKVFQPPIFRGKIAVSFREGTHLKNRRGQSNWVHLPSTNYWLIVGFGLGALDSWDPRK